MIDTTTLNKLAAKQEIDSYTLLREYIQVQFLGALFRIIEPKTVFFKGGTALRLVFGSERFSENLDFTMPKKSSDPHDIVVRTTNTLSGEFPNISVKKLATIAGYSAKLTLPETHPEHPLTIKIDISQREEVIQPQVSPLIVTAVPAPTALVEHLTREEILAEKLRAITHRKKGRDLYDLWWLLHGGVLISVPLVKKKLAFYHETFDESLVRQSVKLWGERELVQDLAKFLPKSKRRIIPELPRLTLELLTKALSSN